MVAKAIRHLPSSEVLCYLDVTAIHLADTWSHLQILLKVLAAFRATDLQISPEKAQLFQDRIKYLGHEVSTRGISIPPEYASVINDWPIPNSIKTLRAFLRKCGYYCRLIADYASLSALLVQYTKQDQHEGIPHLHRDPAAMAAFRTMEKKLMSASILAYPQFYGKSFILDTDFSIDPGAIGGVLSQVQDGQERVIAYGAQRLQPLERNYASMKGELLAVIFFLQYYKYFRRVHPVSAARCYNKLPVVLQLPQHLAPQAVLNFSDSTTYFLDPDSRLLSPIALEISCSALFPAVYQTHSGWITVTREIHQALLPKPLPIPPPRRTDDAFREQDYNEGGLYRSNTLDAMQDFLLTPLLHEAVTYKLAHQIHNLWPEKEYALGPLHMFPAGIADAADWRNLIFRGWWSWLEKWGKMVSIFLLSTTSMCWEDGYLRPSFLSGSFTKNMDSVPTF